MELTGRVLAKNTLSSILGQLLPLIVGFLCVPIIIRHLELDRFGLLSLMWTVIGYFAFLDLGLGRAIVKLVAERIGRSDNKEISSIVWTSLGIMTILSSVGGFILVLVSPWLTTAAYNIPNELHDECLKSFIVLALTVFPVTMTAGVRGVMEARQQFSLINILQAIMGVMTYVSPLFVFPFSKSVYATVLILSFVRWLSLFTHIAISYYYYPEYFFPINFDKKMIPRLFRFGTWLTLSNLIISVKVYMDRFLLGAFLPIAKLSFYTTPLEILSRILFVPGALVRVLFPAFATIRAHNPETLGAVYDRGLKAIGFTLMCLVLFVMYFAKEGMTLWLGESFAAESAQILQVLSIGTFVNGLAWMPFTYIHSAERPDLTTKLHIIEVILYAVILYFFIMNEGLMGAAFARSFIELFDMIALFYLSKRIFSDTKLALRSSIRMCVLILIVIIPSFVVSAVHYKIIFFIISFLAMFIIYWTYLLNIEDRIHIFDFISPLTPLSVESLSNRQFNKMGAVIVTYHPEDSVKINIEQVSRQVEHLVIVDNGSKIEIQNELKKLENQKIKIILNNENLGLGFALNQGVKELINLGCDWVLTLDQDSSIQSDYVASMEQCFRSSNVKDKDQVYVLSPVHIDEKTGSQLNPREVTKKGYRYIKIAITSGQIIDVRAFRDVGLFDDKLFIDYLDHDFCLRLLRRGFKVMEMDNVKLKHNLGSPEWYRFGPWMFIITHHSVIRRYFITRNRLLLYKRYFFLEPDWVFSDFARFLKETFKIAFFEKNRQKKLYATLSGLLHGLTGRQGYYGKKSKLP